MPADFDDRTDFENADRGFIATIDPMVIPDEHGVPVWSMDRFAFLEGEAPETVHPSLWRQGQLTVKHGLYEVTDGIYQIRGFDLSNMTLVEGDTGVIVIDPLISVECAAAGLALYREHRGDRPVSAVIYTHSHIDHFGGVLGVVDADTDVPIVAPAGFMEHAVEENVYAGPAMLRRGMYYSGAGLDPAPTGLVGVGLGQDTSHGRVTLLPPSLTITETGQKEVLDGVRIRFQMTPNTEAPSEMNFQFPDRRALCMSENATHNLHNLLTLRGAVVRDARMWSRYLAEAVDLFSDGSDVAFASHHWPTWGGEAIVRYLSQQRDLYAYLHDQTLRLINKGLVGSEIAEGFEMPPDLDRAWHTHGYYGSVSHNVKGIYQRYLGWYDGNPAHLWQHPPEAVARRYVEAIGGIDATVAKAQGYLDAGDLRFAAELASHAVFADPTNADARDVLVRAFQTMGFAAENATWRNCFLMGATELRDGVFTTPINASDPSVVSAMTVSQLFDSVGIRVDGPKAWNESFSIAWHVREDATYRMELSNGALIHFPTERGIETDAAVTLTRTELMAVLGTGNVAALDVTGDAGVLERLLSLIDDADPNFDVVTP